MHNIVLVYAALASTIIVYPVCTFIVIFLDRKTLEEKNVKLRVGKFYEEVCTRSKVKRIYPLVFAMRRVIIICNAFLMGGFGGIQILTFQLMNMFIFIYVGNVRPFLKSKDNKNNIVHESVVFNLTILISLFSDYCPDE